MNQATEVRLLAERQMGAFLREMPKAKGGAQYHPEGSPTAPMTGVRQPPVPTLADIGITKEKSKIAQKLADIPEPEFQERVAVAKASGGKLSTAKVLCPSTAPRFLCET